MLKVMTIVGTRPELIKMSRVINEMDLFTKHILVHSGQNYDYELNQIFFDDLEIRKPDYFLEAAGVNTAQTIALIIEKSDEVMEKEKPDAILLYGDTNSCLSVIAAKKRKIPIFHMEAGNRCFDQRVPEEVNRKILDHLSDMNLVISEHARRYLISEGVKPETIIKTGSHMREVLDYYKPKIKKAEILENLNLSAGEFFVVSIHREENVESNENLQDFLESLNAIAEQYKFRLIVSTHPRTRKKIDEIENLAMNSLVEFIKPFGFCDYIKLQQNAFCIISDSGTIFEETSLLNLPSITIRNTHERPEGMDAGLLILCGLRKENILDAIKVITNQHNKSHHAISKVHDYESYGVSKLILRTVMSYTNYINRTVWMKDS